MAKLDISRLSNSSQPGRTMSCLRLTTTALLCFCAAILLNCGGDNPQPPSPYPGRLDPNSGWTSYGTGTGFIARLPNPFTIPAQSSGKTINYVYTMPTGLRIGFPIRFNYSVVGDAKFAPLPESGCGAGGCGSAKIRLFFWSNISNTNQDRWWCSPAVDLVIGDNQEITCNMDPYVWTGVSGQVSAEQFAAAVQSPFAMGFTFGGIFAGHGVWTTSGNSTFQVHSYTIQ